MRPQDDLSLVIFLPSPSGVFPFLPFLRRHRQLLVTPSPSWWFTVRGDFAKPSFSIFSPPTGYTPCNARSRPFFSTTTTFFIIFFSRPGARSLLLPLTAQPSSVQDWTTRIPPSPESNPKYHPSRSPFDSPVSGHRCLWKPEN